MEPNNKKMILQHFAELVEEYDLRPIFTDLSNKDKSFKEIVDHTNFDDLHIQHNNRALLLELLDCKPIMFNKFVYSLRKHTDRKYTIMANKLENKFTVQKLHKTSCYQAAAEPEYVQDVTSNTYLEDTDPLIINIEYSEQFCDNNLQDSINSKIECYRTRSKNRGNVLIINNIEFEGHKRRQGADVDEKNLTELFKKMGLSVESQRNLTMVQMKDLISKFADKDISDYENKPDICLVIIMSHGERIHNRTTIVGVDGMGLEEEWVTSQFNNNSCLLFQNRPKIFIFHICRGELQDNQTLKYTTESDSACSKGPELETKTVDQRHFSDMIVCHPSVDGFKAHRNIFKGCWYMELLCKVFMENAHEMDVESMLKLVDRELSRRMSEECARQTSTYTNIGFKTCYINPGIYEEGGEVVKFEQSI